LGLGDLHDLIVLGNAQLGHVQVLHHVLQGAHLKLVKFGLLPPCRAFILLGSLLLLEFVTLDEGGGLCPRRELTGGLLLVFQCVPERLELQFETGLVLPDLGLALPDEVGLDEFEHSDLVLHDFDEVVFVIDEYVLEIV